MALDQPGVAVDPRTVDQFAVGAVVDEPPAVEDQDVVGPICGEPVGTIIRTAKTAED